MSKNPPISKLLLEAIKEWVRDRAQGMAPALAYYELLCITPLIGFLLFFSFKVMGPKAVEEDVIPFLKNSLGPQMAKVVKFFFARESKVNMEDIYTISVLSALLFLWASKQYFEQIRRVVESTWNLNHDKIGLKAFFNRSFNALKIAIVSVLIFIFFIFLRSILPHPYIGKEDQILEVNFFVMNIAQWIMHLLLFTFLYVFYFTYIPPVKVNWKNTIPGAILGALLLIIGKEIMEVNYRERPEADVAESLIIVLLWFYYSNFAFIYSAEFTKLYVASRQNIDLRSLKFGEDV
jgi:membrane protein